MNFYEQRANLRKLHRSQFLSCTNTTEFPQNAGEPLSKRDPNTYIYLKESLTPLNNYFMKEAKKCAKNYGYKYTGYTYKGEVRVRKSDTSKFIAIKKESDLDKIK